MTHNQYIHKNNRKNTQKEKEQKMYKYTHNAPLNIRTKVVWNCSPNDLSFLVTHIWYVWITLLIGIHNDNSPFAC